MDGIITIDAGQQVVLFNPAAETIFRIPAAQALGQPLPRFIPERYRDAHAGHVTAFLGSAAAHQAMGPPGIVLGARTVSGLRADGEEFPIEASISQVEVGGARFATVILRDITERIANEEARELLAREVDHRAKNALAVVQALVSLTRASTQEEFVAAVRGRVSGRLAPPASEAALPTVGSEGRVLVVEDDALVAMDTGEHLDALGWEVVGPATTLEEAERLLADQPAPDIAVLDVNLRGRLVYPLADQLRASGVPLIFCTGYEQVDARYRDYPVVRKPVDVRLLDAELRGLRKPAA